MIKVLTLSYQFTDEYTLIADMVDSFTVTVTKTQGIKDYSSDIWMDTYTKGHRGLAVDGGSTNPPKFVIHFSMESDTAQISFDDHTDFVVRTTTINLTKPGE